MSDPETGSILLAAVGVLVGMWGQEPGAGLRPPVRVEAAGVPIDLVADIGYAGPAVHDLDGDGRLDLLAGALSGRILCFRNAAPGHDGTPVLAAGRPLEAEGAEIRISNW